MAELNPIDAAARAREVADFNAARNHRLADQRRLEQERALERIATEERRLEAARRDADAVRNIREDNRDAQDRERRLQQLDRDRQDEIERQRERQEETDLLARRAEGRGDDLGFEQAAPAPDRFREELRARDARLRERADDDRLFEQQQQLALRQADAAIRSAASPDPTRGRGALVDVAG